jgi:protein-L-isoaspartate(D-aspartate) O-methyltransferase
MDEKQALLTVIDNEIAATAPLTGRAALSARVRAALEKIPRNAFVPETEAALAYLNAPLPIGHGQTISQPFIVAIMTELLDLRPDDIVLEIGTGSGYQAAILGTLARQVYSIEFVPDLAATARATLMAQGFTTIEIRTGDGSLGWPEHAPYDAIIVTAAASRVPPALLGQLKPSGRLVLPVGQAGRPQTLVLITKDASGVIERHDIMGVAFVPLVGGTKH